MSAPTVYGQSTIPQMEPIKVLATAIQSQMNLGDRNIMLDLTNWEIPEDDQGLYVSLAYGPEIVIANELSNSLDSDGNYVEVLSSVMLHQIDVDVMSFNSSARTSKEQVLWSLTSQYALSLMEQYQMRFASTPGSFIPVSDLEPAKQLNRFRLSVLVNALHQTTQAAGYISSLQPVQLVENP